MNASGKINFSIKWTSKREFSDEEVETLLKNKSTPILEPFKKNDTTFRAALELREGGKIAFNKLTVEVIKKG